MKDASVTIIGGGVLAVTLGVLLRAGGASVRMFAGERADRAGLETAGPDFASAFPAASVIPHSVGLAGLGPVLEVSLRMFEVLEAQIPSMVRKQWHYEVFEEGAAEPTYLSEFSRVERFSEAGTAECPLRRTTDCPVTGWRFRSFFVEAPEYLETLFRIFEGLGGSVETGRIRDADQVATLPGDALVLCAGMGTPGLLGRLEDKHFEEGHLISLPVRIESLERGPASYNYTPQPSVHPDGLGGAFDVYAYPRRTTLILGGTRLPGVENARGEVRLEEYRGPTTQVLDHRGRPHRIPVALIELNRVLVRQLLGVDIDGLPMKIARGRRYRGSSPDAGVTEVIETAGGRSVLACYGLGGAGVTLSWGLAARLAARLEAELGASALGFEEVLEDRVAARIAAQARKAARILPAIE